MKTFLKMASLYVIFVLSSAFTLWLIQGVPLWKGILLAAGGNALKTLIAHAHGAIWTEENQVDAH